MGNKVKMTAVGLALVASAGAQAAGFALIEQSASGMGNAFAGGAAGAEDASTVFFNPAGMTYIEGMQAVNALHLISPNFEFEDDGSVAGTARPLGDEGPDAGDIAFVPNLYWVTDINESVKFGVGVNAPFGLKTEYDDEWIGRFQAIKSEVKTININPSVAFKVNDQLSLGFGVSAMWAQAELTRQVNLGAAETDVKIKGDDWGFGYNLGAIYQATADTRIGIAYRSHVKQEVEGEAKFGDALSANDADIRATVELPESFSASVFSRVNDKWDVMADATWTRWSRFKELRIEFDSATLADSVTPENWENTMRYSVGANYHYSDAIKLRAGLAYDESPVINEDRTARIPGNDRKWVSLGASYQHSPASTFDIGYSHLFISDVKIDDDQTGVTPLGNGRVKGKYKGSVDILSVQLTHTF